MDAQSFSRCLPDFRDHAIIAIAEARCSYRGVQENSAGRMVPVYKVRGWRAPNEDGAARPYVDAHVFAADPARFVPWRNPLTGERGWYDRVYLPLARELGIAVAPPASDALPGRWVAQWGVPGIRWEA